MPNLATLMANHIRASLAPEISARAVLVAPANGNVMLAEATARVMRRPVVLLRDRPRIRRNQFWDGVFPHDAYPVIVHDVAVTGHQLAEAQDKLGIGGRRAREVFCFVDRTDET